VPSTFLFGERHLRKVLAVYGAQRSMWSPRIVTVSIASGG
jgi:hypothetical protein